MKPSLLTALLFSTFLVHAQPKPAKIIREYNRGEGPTQLNEGRGFLNTETHYDKQNRVIKHIQFGGYGYKSYETLTSYHYDSKPVSITKIDYPKGFWPGTVSLQSLSADHPQRKPDTSVQRHIYQDTLLVKIESYRNGHMSSWTEYTYNDDGYEIELANFYSRGSRERWVKTDRDKDNRPIKIREFYQDSSVKFTETRTYNSKGLLKEKDYRSKYLTYHVVTTYSYNSDGLKTKEVAKVHSPEDRKEIRTQLFDYNAKGLLIKEGGLDSLGKTVWHKQHHYNSKGQVVRTDFEKFVYFYDYNKSGDLISRRFEDSRSTAEGKIRYIYKNGLLQKTEHHNREALSYYTKNYYSKSGKLIRQEPMLAEGRDALDWIKYYYYNEKGQLVRMKHKHPGHNNFLNPVTTIGWGKSSNQPQPKPDPYKNYVDSYTYYTYDDKGRQVNEYHKGGEFTTIMKIYEDNYGILETNHDIYGMASMIYHMISRLDTVKVEKHGGLTKITLSLDYTQETPKGNYQLNTYRHQNLTRIETFNEKNELVELKEITENGIVLFHSNGKTLKSLNNHNAYSHSRLDLIQFRRYTLDTVSTTLYNSDGLEYLVTNRAGDTIDFSYENDRLTRKIKRYGSGYFSLKTYDYDKKGFKTMERDFKEDGIENSRVVFENDGKHIISEQRINVRANRETLYEVTYLNP